ncbi:MAG: hypothetical protein R2825_22025 [Saprospiraceae bacterium]
MSDIAIKVENLSKSYRIWRGEAARYTALRDVMAEQAAQFSSVWPKAGILFLNPTNTKPSGLWMMSVLK